MKKSYFILPLLLITSLHSETIWKIDSQEEWEKTSGEAADLKVAGGMIEPTGKEATFQSELKEFDEKRSASSIQIDQSPVWMNWNKAGNIGTGSMNDAPVLLSLGPQDYWMFDRYSGPSKQARERAKAKGFVPTEVKLEGFDIPLMTTALPNEFDAPSAKKKSAGGYHAWRSRDMKNWVHYGSITDSEGKWMTTAEYVDGKFYFYYDFPNDQDPHLIIDEDPTDGVVGKKMGLVFKDPSDGSDCAFIRDLDGNFHVIYEDWSPIDAKKRSWDSPLAGHAVSKDGKGDFKMLAPAVDLRTKATGETGTYTHPHWTKEDPANYPNSEGHL